MIVRRIQTGGSGRTGRGRPRGREDLHEDYQTLVRRIRASIDGSDGAARAIGVTSCSRGAGVSTVAGNLAIAEAIASPDETLLVDANLARPSLQRRFGVPLAPGLVNVLCGESAADCLQPSPVSNLRLLTAGSSDCQAKPGYRHSEMEELLRVFRGEFPTVVVDLPAVTGSSGCSPLVGALDGVILVIEAERTDSRSALYARQRLLELNANILGVVLNKRRMHIPGWLYRIL
jgi:Mrp family chromosome partitioning ATPase